MDNTSVTVYIGGDHYFMTFLYAGLLRLQNKDGLTVRFVRPFRRTVPRHNDNLILSLELQRGGRNKRICFDLADSQAHFSMQALADHDLYFKRSISTSGFPELAPEFAAKVRPWGPMFSCRYTNFAQAFVNIFSGFLASATESISLKNRLGQFYNYIRLAPLAEYEKMARQNHGGLVLFQSRAWHSGNYQDWREINESRARVIRALKKRFRDRFVGGFIPDATSQKYYADAISPFSSSRRDYLQLIRQAQICVYTRGLFDSPAFKLAEYLAAGRCIVAEPLQITLAEPMQEGRHYLSFGKADQCVQRCETLLENDDMAEEMMKHNRQYYTDQVEPSRQMSRAIESALSNSVESHETVV